MSYTTDDIGRRFDEAAGRGADGIALGQDPYDAVAYGGPGKAAAPAYAARVAAVLAQERRITQIYNQGQDQVTGAIFQARPWLNANDVYWVHCFSGNAPDPTPYRVYVCTQLAETHNVLRQLLQAYPGELKFKVATHAEAQVRNDTIVSWHPSLLTARAWADVARANAGHLEGAAPAGTFGGLDTHAVGIDTEVAGDTSTSRVARAAETEVQRRHERRLRNNPYL